MSPTEEFEAESSNIVIVLRAMLSLFGSLLGLILSLPILVVGLPFWITAVGTRLIARRLVPRTVRWQEIIEFDFRFGWKPKPNLNVQCFGDDVFRVTTGPDGWRGNISLAECDIVVLGDSFAFGYGVNEQAMFAELIPNVRVKPIGAPGYNLVQELLVLREYCSQLTGSSSCGLYFWGMIPGTIYTPICRTTRHPFFAVSTSIVIGKLRPVTSVQRRDPTSRKNGMTSTFVRCWRISVPLCILPSGPIPRAGISSARHNRSATITGRGFASLRCQTVLN